MDCMYRPVGRASISARLNVSGCAAFSTSTVATRASTLTVWPTEPTFNSASTDTAPLAGTSTVCLILTNPGRVTVTTYVPGRKSTIAYRPSLLVITARVCSISTSLEASTVALATTAPEASLTTPEMVLCADTTDGQISSRQPSETNLGLPVKARTRTHSALIGLPSTEHKSGHESIPKPAGR